MNKLTILLFFLAALAITSCKKSYTCDCTLTDYYSSGDTSYTNIINTTSSAYSKKMTKKEAQAACDHEAIAVKSNFDSFENSLLTTFGGTADPNEHISADCKLK